MCLKWLHVDRSFVLGLYFSIKKSSASVDWSEFRSPQSLPAQLPLQRKKSLPDVQGLGYAAEAMSREEVSALGSARREEVRRIADENERLRANPLLYLVSPQVKVRQSYLYCAIILIYESLVCINLLSIGYWTINSLTDVFRFIVIDMLIGISFNFNK